VCRNWEAMAATSSYNRISPTNLSEDGLRLYNMDEEVLYFDEDEEQSELSVDLDDSFYEEPSEEPKNLKLYLKRTTLLSRIQKVYSKLTLDNARKFTAWLFDGAVLHFTISVSLWFLGDVIQQNTPYRTSHQHWLIPALLNCLFPLLLLHHTDGGHNDADDDIRAVWGRHKVVVCSFF